MVSEKSKGCFMSFLFLRLVQRQNVRMKILKQAGLEQEIRRILTVVPIDI